VAGLFVFRTLRTFTSKSLWRVITSIDIARSAVLGIAMKGNLSSTAIEMVRHGVLTVRLLARSGATTANR